MATYKTNRIDELLSKHNRPFLSIFYTAGYPNLNDTVSMAAALEAAGVDMLEIGMPYSDPLADGPVIQASSTAALQNGMTIPVLLDQLKDLRNHVNIPVLLMGYYNPILQYGLDRFELEAIACGIDGLIVPDMPLEQLEKRLQLPWAHQLKRILLVSPQTSEARIRTIESLGSGFIYAVASASVTGGTASIQASQEAYFNRLQAMKLRLPLFIGFGINNAETFATATKYSAGAIVGSAFVKFLAQHQAIGTSWQAPLPGFAHALRPPTSSPNNISPLIESTTATA